MFSKAMCSIAARFQNTIHAIVHKTVLFLDNNSAVIVRIICPLLSRFSTAPQRTCERISSRIAWFFASCFLLFCFFSLSLSGVIVCNVGACHQDNTDFTFYGRHYSFGKYRYISFRCKQRTKMTASWLISSPIRYLPNRIR